jgi:protein XRP2
MSDVVFEDLTGQSLTKHPGTVDGGSVTLRNLTECSVYILDHSTYLSVSQCTDCQIFVGPVGGIALFTDVVGGKACVAAQEFQAKRCTNVEFGLYSAQKPQISGSNGLSFKTWTGAYPKLGQHFRAANLDPASNQWNQVEDTDGLEAGEATFQLLDASDYWEVPIEGHGAPENPVPGPGGAVYTYANDGASPLAGAGLPPAANGGFDSSPFDEADFSEPAGANGVGGGGYAPPPNASGVSAAFAPPAEEPEAVTAMKEHLRTRMREQEEAEVAAKKKGEEESRAFLEEFYQKRTATKNASIEEHREAHKLLGSQKPEGNNEWERAISLIDFNFSRPSGVDLSRYRNVLFNAKSRNQPSVAAK